jgi:ASC-1-like (ASCH) protein
MIIKKKTWPELFEALKSGKKNFDLRLNDFKCRAGDIIVFQEWNPKTKKYTGRELKKKVSYIMKTKNLKFWSKKDIKKYGYQIISLK